MDAVDAIQEFMDRTGLKRKDLFSSKRQASDVMNRKRPLTLVTIQKLHFQYGIPAEILITATVANNGKYPLTPYTM